MRRALRSLARLRQRTVAVPFVGAVAAVIVFAFMLLLLWSSKRRRDPAVDVEEGEGPYSFIANLVGSTHSTLTAGNRIEIVEDGRFFDVMMEALRAAESSITFETFLWVPGRLSREIVNILSDRSTEGVSVKVLLDGSSGNASFAERRQLREAGCEVKIYHPFRISNAGLLNNRDHRKLVVVDGRVAFLGGHCISDAWLHDGTGAGFRDVSVKIEGPIVSEVQSVFMENWLEETGRILVGESFFPQIEPCGDVATHLVYVNPTNTLSSLGVLHHVAIRLARQRVWIQNPYFLPDPELIDKLVEAVARGIDVRIMLPAASATDHPIVQHASHHRFGAFLEGGIRILEYQKTLLHQKVMTIDGIWAAVGSTNFDDRSFEINDEVTLGIFDERLSRKFEEIFERDSEDCTELTLDVWKKRTLLHRLTDGAAFLLNEQL